MKNKIDDLQDTLDKFTKGRDNLNLLLGNQRVSYNKVCLGYKLKDNSKKFSNICNAQQTSKCETLKFNYGNKDDHVAMFCFIKMSHESKERHPHSYFYKEHFEIKKIKMFAHNIYFINIKGLKKIWVPKVENLTYDVDDDNNSCSSSHTIEEINMLYCYPPMRK